MTAPDYGSSARRVEGSLYFKCDFWFNAEGGPKNKSAVWMDYFVFEALKVGSTAVVDEVAKKNPGKIPGFRIY